MLELGRSCVHRDYRSGIILKLLWQGISNYINNYKIKILFGCASFQGTDPEKFKNEFNLSLKSLSSLLEGNSSNTTYSKPLVGFCLKSSEFLFM